MGNSLRDQLLKSGLASKSQANKVKKQKKVEEKLRRHNKVEVVDEAKRLAEKAAAEQAQRARELNKKKQQEAENKAIAAQVKQLVEVNRLPRDDAEIDYRFTDQKTIKTIAVTPELQQQLVAGQLAIVRLNQQYELVPSAVADKIIQRDPESIVMLSEPSERDTKDDPYADYQVPDDLMW